MIDLNEGYAFLARGDVWSWAAALALTLFFTLIARIALATLTRYLRALSARTPFQWDDILVNMLGTTRWWAIFFLLLNFVEKLMVISPRLDRITDVVTVFTTSIQIIIWAFAIVRGWHRTYLEARVQRDASSAAALNLIYTFLRTAVVVIVSLSALNNLGVDVHALVASLGVGSLAVALAGKSILEDLLASFSIVLDKPFAVGDAIVVGEMNGTVEYIGIKTTRVRSNTGELIVFPNRNILDGRVKNYRSLTQRRVTQRFAVVRSTPPEKLARIPDWIREVIAGLPPLKCERCHFAYVTENSLDFELVFVAQTADYVLYMDQQQRLFLGVLERFAKEGVALSYPSRSVYVEKLPGDVAVPKQS